MKKGKREKRKNQKDRMKSKEEERKKWIWRMQLDTYRENGNGFKKKANFYKRKERVRKEAKKRRNDKFSQFIFNFVIFLNKMVEEQIKIGNPWSILPIKNAKYARDLVEVHLCDRDLDLLEKFEDFPNLEVIWLSNNKVTYNSS